MRMRISKSYFFAGTQMHAEKFTQRYVQRTQNFVTETFKINKKGNIFNFLFYNQNVADSKKKGGSMSPRSPLLKTLGNTVKYCMILTDVLSTTLTLTLTALTISIN